MRKRSASVSDADEIEAIAKWCEYRFGPITAERLILRAQAEMDELLAEIGTLAEGWTEPARMEAADVVIVLSRVPGLMDAVREKMAENRLRTFVVHGDGTGSRVKPREATNDPSGPCAYCGQNTREKLAPGNFAHDRCYQMDRANTLGEAYPSRRP